MMKVFYRREQEGDRILLGRRFGLRWRGGSPARSLMGKQERAENRPGRLWAVAIAA